TNIGTIVHLWKRIEDRDGIYYRINREHPLIETLSRLLGEDEDIGLQGILHEIEQTFPIEQLYADMGTDAARVHQRSDYTDEELSLLASEMLKACDGNQTVRNTILTNLHTIEPFSFKPDLAREIVARIKNVH